MKLVWALVFVLFAAPLAQAQDSIERIGLVPVDTGSPEQMQAFVRSEIARWGEVVKRSGASVE